MTEELSKVYEPKEIERFAEKIWESGNYFHTEPPAKGGRNSTAYTIVIPPPNVTGALHMGHAIDNTLQDVLIRFKRMQGFNTLWMPGTDHAGIATQSVVEKNLKAKTGKTRHDVGREKLVEMIWEWKEQYGNRILGQLKRIGASCDWQRTRFTLDQMCAKAVRHTFVNLFKKGLIYRGKRLVNWDSVLQTAVADDEVVHKTIKGNFWYIKYPLDDGSGFVTIATTRPETMLGDTAVAVNPKDKRAKSLIGKRLQLPLTGRVISIIGDDYVKLGEGTGFLKVTPAHDPNDYEIGLRHKLEMINILTPDGKINENGGKFAGMDRYAARKAIVAELESLGLIEKIEPREHEVGHSDRSGDIIEPYLSDQWFVKVGPLAKNAIEAVESGKVKFHPERYGKSYLDWLYGIRDWCISRQLWWGHRIPIWYCGNCEHINTGIDDPTECEKCKSKDLKQDPDVLDTWFSSALWPHSTLGWPEQTEELKFYYPTNTLVTARDIITLWVSRMVMMGLENMGQVPFSDVFIHPTILDGNGERMSKSKGNGIDPLDIIDTYGADAMRFSLCQMTTESQDLKLPVTKDEHGKNISEKFDIGRNFCNKVWNASRFSMMNLEGLNYDAFDAAKLHITDKWILSRLAQTVNEVTTKLDSFEVSEPLMAIYRFFWNDLCDWYVEWIKPRIKDASQKDAPQNVLAFVLDYTLRMLHPFIPFITEGIYQKLNEVAPKRGLKGITNNQGTNSNNEITKKQETNSNAEALIIAQWPKGLDKFIDAKTESEITTVQETVRAIREIRNKYTVAPSKKLAASANAPADTAKILNDNADLICDRANLEKFSASPEMAKPENAAASVIEQTQIFVEGLIDAQAELKRLGKQRDEIMAGVKGNESKLSNANFISRAKPEVVEQTKQRLAELKEQLAVIENNIAALKNSH
ncbi:MAG: valine--tRNA ligase [Phycisphaerales bacterium]